MAQTKRRAWTYHLPGYSIEVQAWGALHTYTLNSQCCIVSHACSDHLQSMATDKQLAAVGCGG
jgi:hypothetical protein